MDQRYLKYWIQSYLAGVPQIKVGLRNDEGHLLEVLTLQTKDLGSRSYRSPMQNARWNPLVVIDFMDAFCSFAREKISQAPSDVTLRFRYEPSSQTISVNPAPLESQSLNASLRAILES
uniref:Decapping nuclease n=1 Tax=Timspurckia oligopyrenoides TaxID=708627 RepID=A0A7S0ZGP8_9RHOD|mmetsp:Transcript_4450/g.7801  ORF Transcript_4450/g.7801 Transcript_4450/m.7801 type:complete len:119 (+) Transcript_4450:1-357(+)